MLTLPSQILSPTPHGFARRVTAVARRAAAMTALAVHAVALAAAPAPVSLLLPPDPAAAAADAAPPVALPGTRHLAMQSAKGREYRIMITEAKDPAPANGYQVLYVLDGNSVFGAFSDTLRLQRFEFDKAMVVAIGYPTDQPYDFKGRSYDYSPPAPAGRERPPGAPALGGHDEMLDFIEHQLQPELARRYKVDRTQQSLFGHSFGGMFTLHALYTRPWLFNHYIAASPSIWWQDRYLLPEEHAFTQRAQAGQVNLMKTTLMLFAGGREPPMMLRDAQALHGRLQALSGLGLTTSYETLADETHGTVPIAAITRVMRHVFTARTR
jgi:predicted alpha/beta superfamily hydrolase